MLSKTALSKIVLRLLVLSPTLPPPLNFDLSSMKNILVLNYEFPPLWWWQANANYYLFKEFAKFPDYNFTLITSSANKEKTEQFAENITIHYLDIGKNWQNLHNQWIKDLFKNAYKTYKLSKKLIKQEGFDLIMCWSYPAIWIWYKLNKKYNIPYISLLRWADIPFYEQKWKNLDRFVFQYLAPKFWKNSKYVIANSSKLKNLALKISPKQDIQIITNWIDLEEFSTCEFSAKQRDQKSISQGKNNSNKKDNKNFNTLFVWRLTVRKWILELSKAFEKFSKDKENVKLNIVGDGNLYNELKNFVDNHNLNNKITLHWLVNHNQIKDFYHQNDVYVLPSSNEWMSNTLLEAMASSMPVIITDVWWTSELFDWNWWIIKIGSIEDIQEKLELAYQSWQEWSLEKLWKKSFEVVRTMSWENKAKEFLDKIKGERLKVKG